MRAQFMLIPPALIAGVQVHAAVYLDLERAQALLFPPGATFTPAFKQLSDAEAATIRDEAEVKVWNAEVKAWRVSTGGWLIVDQVLGSDDWVSYAIALDNAGTVIGIEVLECQTHYDGVATPQWLAQFKGLNPKNRGSRAIISISGSTLSSEHIAQGVQRVLVTFARVLRSKT